MIHLHTFLIEQLSVAAVGMPPCHVFVNVKNVFFVKVPCISCDTFKHARLEESAAGCGLGTHYLCLLELWVLTGSLVSPFFPFTVLIGLFAQMANKIVVVVCECILCGMGVYHAAKFFKPFSCVLYSEQESVVERGGGI